MSQRWRAPPREASDDSQPPVLVTLLAVLAAANHKPGGGRVSTVPGHVGEGGWLACCRRSAWPGGVSTGRRCLYTLFRRKVLGPAHRDWYHRIHSTMLLHVLALQTHRPVEDKNMCGVITVNEEYETRFLCNSAKEWRKVGVEQHNSAQWTGLESQPQLTSRGGVQFALKCQSLGQSVYLHWKAGCSRSAPMVKRF